LLNIQGIWVKFVIGVAVAGCLSGCTHSAKSSALSRELDKLRATNGLYERPQVYELTQPDLQSSAYGLTVMKLAGGSPAAPWGDATVRDAANSVLADNSVWGQWYLNEIAVATGSSAPSPQAAIVGSLNPVGYFDDKPARPTDDASRLAATAAALRVMSRSKIALSAPSRVAVLSWLSSRVRTAANPYQLCNAVTALTDLGQHVIPDSSMVATLNSWWTARSRSGLVSPEDTLDLMGYVCASHALGLLDAERAARVRRLTEPYLSSHAEPSIAFNLAESWSLSGGSPASLRQLATEMQDRIIAPTGLLGRTINKVGTLQSSYAVTQIRLLTGAPTKDKKLAAAVDAALAHGPADSSGLNSLMAATILRTAGAPQPQLERTVTDQVLSAAPTTIDPSNIGTWAQVVPILVSMNLKKFPTPTLTTWKTNTVLGRYEAWLALGLDGQAVQSSAAKQFSEILVSTPGLLNNDAESLSMKELSAAVNALANNNQSKLVPWPKVVAALTGLKGCGSFTQLYRPAGDATECDLDATASGYFLTSLIPRTPEVSPS
jgi:hypothetical protein